MGEWQRLFRRFREMVNPPRYPEYEEYRDEKESPGAGLGAGAGAPDEATLKMRRVQMVAGLAILLSLGGGAWLYFSDSSGSADRDPLLREALANEMLKTTEGEQASPPRDSIDDIKRWASDLERRMERGGYDSMTSAPPAAVPLPGSRPQAPYYGQGFDANQPLVLPDPSLNYGETGTGGAPFADVAPAVQPVAGPSRLPSSSTAPASPAVAPASSASPAASSSQPPANAGDPALRPDTPLRPYQRRSLEPVTYDPRNVDPY